MNLIYQGALLMTSRIDMHQTALGGTCKVMSERVATLRRLVPMQTVLLDKAERLIAKVRANTTDLHVCAQALGELLQTFQDLWDAVPATSDAATLLCQLDNRVKSARALVADWMREGER